MNNVQLSADEETRSFFRKVYLWMSAGLALSGGTAYFIASRPALYEPIFSNSIIFYGLLIGELGLVILLAALIRRMSAGTAMFVFLLYCFTTGLTLSVVFLVYTTASIALTFFIAAGMFGVMSVYGFVTRADLTKMGHILLMALFGLIIASVANWFFQSTTADYIISFIGVIIFTLLTAYDTQKIRQMNILGNAGTGEDTKEAIIGALNLYLDFINLFLHLLRFFGRRR